MAKDIQYKCPDGSEASGYLASADGSTAGIIVIQEWWGLNDQIRAVANRYAQASFTALAPDLYHGRVTTEEDEASHLMEGLDWVGATEQEVRGAAQHLKDQGNTKVGVLGFCMGGALTVIAAVKVQEVDAAVCFYGIPPTDAADPAGTRIPFQGHFATEDQWCTPALVNDLEASLKTSGCEYEVFRYQAEHGFFNADRPSVHDPAATALAWDRSVAFLRAHL